MGLLRRFAPSNDTVPPLQWHLTQFVKKQGNNLRRPLSDYLGHGIYELRPKPNRIFYFFFLKDNAVLVHAIRKNTDKIPKKDLVMCIKRKIFVEEYTKVEKVDF